MIFNRFSIAVISLVILISALSLLLVWSLTQQHLVISKFTFACIWIILVVTLIQYVTRTNKKLKIFLESVKSLDLVRSSKGESKAFKELNLTYNEIIDYIRKARTDKEGEHFYFLNTIENIATGIITFDNKGKVELYNKASKELLGFPRLKNISELDKIKEGLTSLVKSLKNNQSKLIDILIKDELNKLSIKTTELIIQKKTIKIIAIHNIKNELEEEEINAWQKLIRVLTHEIMNSVTPIKSLVNTTIKMFEHDGKPIASNKINNSTIQDVLQGLHAIEKRNNGLISFVEDYKSLTRVPKPNFSIISVKDLLDHLVLLCKEKLKQKNININIEVPPKDIYIHADEKLIAQVLLNLIQNSIEGLENKKDKTIKIKAFFTEKEQKAIEVSDNGKGIEKEMLDKIFIPFFTTKEKGSGIGLSLSRQIMRLHNGSVSVSSLPNIKTVFRLIF